MSFQHLHAPDPTSRGNLTWAAVGQAICRAAGNSGCEAGLAASCSHSSILAVQNEYSSRSTRVTRARESRGKDTPGPGRAGLRRIPDLAQTLSQSSESRFSCKRMCLQPNAICGLLKRSGVCQWTHPAPWQSQSRLYHDFACESFCGHGPANRSASGQDLAIGTLRCVVFILLALQTRMFN